jgi:hypothetical protein
LTDFTLALLGDREAGINTYMHPSVTENKSFKKLTSKEKLEYANLFKRITAFYEWG